MTQKRALLGMNSGHFVTFSNYGRRQLRTKAQTRDIVIASLDLLACEDRVRVSGFVIMPDHVHALFRFNDDKAFSGAMNAWKSSSAKALGKWYAEHLPEMIGFLNKMRDGRERTSFWQTRYFDFNILGPEKAREKIEYMHANPVKRGLCKTPGDWRWSSFRWYDSGEDVGVKIVHGF